MTTPLPEGDISECQNYETGENISPRLVNLKTEKEREPSKRRGQSAQEFKIYKQDGKLDASID